MYTHKIEEEDERAYNSGKGSPPVIQKGPGPLGSTQQQFADTNLLKSSGSKSSIIEHIQSQNNPNARNVTSLRGSYQQHNKMLKSDLTGQNLHGHALEQL